MKKIKDYIRDFLEKIEKQNEKTVGKGRLDCCDLNKKKDKKLISK